MISLAELRRMPKDMLINLYKTSQTIMSDDIKALYAIQEERRAPWADYCDPTLKIREAELECKLRRATEWSNMVSVAIGDRRWPIVRVLMGLSDEEQFPSPEIVRVDGGGIPSAALDAVGYALEDA
jgi:hypothetical protein